LTSLPPALPGRPACLAWLPAFLFRTDPVAARYVVKAWALMLGPSLILGWVAARLFPEAPGPNFNVETVGPWMTAFSLVFFAPAVETLILAPLVLLLRRFFGFGPAAIAGAVLWGIAHSLAAPTWGLIVWWPFLIMSIGLMTWRSDGLWKAIALVMIVHALQNVVGAALLLLPEL
jgi:membrane protease YdiL (CAAX protease family)